MREAEDVTKRSRAEERSQCGDAELRYRRLFKTLAPGTLEAEESVRNFTGIIY